MSTIGIILLSIAAIINIILLISREKSGNSKFLVVTRSIATVCLIATVIIYIIAP